MDPVYQRKCRQMSKAVLHVEIIRSDRSLVKITKPVEFTVGQMVSATLPAFLEVGSHDLIRMWLEPVEMDVATLLAGVVLTTV
jgi:hypothetical protein